MLTVHEMSEVEVREANHRMMNLLAILHATFRRNFSQFTDQDVRSAAAQFEGHIMAAGELLRTISSTASTEGVAVEVYVERLSRALSRAILGPANIRCEVFSDSGRLPLHVCERLGFILTELVFNASKYAFADRNNGAVRVVMSRNGRRWRCIVSDNGVGMNGASRGAGLNIVEALVRSLKGRLIIRSATSSGTCVHVLLPDHSVPRGCEGPMSAAKPAAPDNPVIALPALSPASRRRFPIGGAGIAVAARGQTDAEVPRPGKPGRGQERAKGSEGDQICPIELLLATQHYETTGGSRTIPAPARHDRRSIDNG